MSTKVGDFNGDGFMDIAVANATTAGATANLLQPTVTMTANNNNVPVPVGKAATTHGVVAHYEGNPSFKVSDSTAMPVTAAPVTVTIALNPPSGTYPSNPPLQLTATVTPSVAQQNHPIDGLPMSFKNLTTNKTIDSAAWVNGQAAYTTVSGDLAPGRANQVQASSANTDNFTFVSTPNTYAIGAAKQEDRKATSPERKLYLHSPPPRSGTPAGSMPRR
jgi:hypothetical protein